jgi:hypothetical protein
VENFADSCPFPKKAHSFGGVDERQCAVRSEYRRVGADHFSAAARIEVRHFGNIDYKSPYARLKLVQHMFAKADERPVVNHSAGDLDEIDLVSHFRGNLHAPTVFPDSNSCQDSLRSQSAFRVGLTNATFAEQGSISFEPS